MLCTECPTKQEGCEKEYKTSEWWDMRKHYRKYHPEIKDPASLFTKEARTERQIDSAALQQMHGMVVNIKDNGGKICGKGTLAYNPGTNDLAVTGAKIRGRAL